MRRAIEKVVAKIRKKGKNLIVYPEKCPVSLSICLWKQKESQSWKEIERCYAYAGYKDGVVKCRWKEFFLENRRKKRKIKEKVKGQNKSRIKREMS